MMCIFNSAVLDVAIIIAIKRSSRWFLRHDTDIVVLNGTSIILNGNQKDTLSLLHWQSTALN